MGALPGPLQRERRRRVMPGVRHKRERAFHVRFADGTFHRRTVRDLAVLLLGRLQRRFERNLRRVVAEGRESTRVLPEGFPVRGGELLGRREGRDGRGGCGEQRSLRCRCATCPASSGFFPPEGEYRPQGAGRTCATRELIWRVRACRASPSPSRKTNWPRCGGQAGRRKRLRAWGEEC